jgi:hypothetical protein
VNVAFWAPEDGPDEASLRAAANAFIDTVDGLAFALDGVPLGSPFAHREESPPGGFTLMFGDLLAEIGYAAMDRLAVTDGYWVMLEPLSRGLHTIAWLGSSTDFGFATSVIARVRVPEPGTSALLALGMAGYAATGRRRVRR